MAPGDELGASLVHEVKKMDKFKWNLLTQSCLPELGKDIYCKMKSDPEILAFKSFPESLHKVVALYGDTKFTLWRYID
jgi:hypothetical protein